MTTLVRGLTRGLTVLEALSELKFATPMALARKTGLPRATVYRLLDTLGVAGYVARLADSDLYRLTSAVQRLLIGFDDEARLVEVAQPTIDELGREVVWPIDLFTYGPGGAPMIRQSTHGSSPLSFFRSPMVGRSAPMLASSAGRAYLASVPETEISEVIARETSTAESNDETTADPARLERMIGEMRKRGYGYRDGGIMPKTCAIAVPVMHHDRPIASISVMFMRSAMPLAEASEKYLPGIRRAAATIEQRLAAN